MRARTAIAALLAATVALPLAGCFGLPGLDDVADQAEDFASQAQELADTLSDVDWGKVSRLVVRDAQTGEVVRELTDQDQIEGAFTRTRSRAPSTRSPTRTAWPRSRTPTLSTPSSCGSPRRRSSGRTPQTSTR